MCQISNLNHEPITLIESKFEYNFLQTCEHDIKVIDRLVCAEKQNTDITEVDQYKEKSEKLVCMMVHYIMIAVFDPKRRDAFVGINPKGVRDAWQHVLGLKALCQ